MDIQISSLTKVYREGAPPALDDLNLRIRSGTFGLLGPNGAGKTTLIKILSTQMKASAGSVVIDGLPIDVERAQVRDRLGYLPQHFGAYPKLTAFEFLDYMGRLADLHPRKKRREAVEQALEAVGLASVRDRRTGTFSGGMTRRLGIAQAILSDPPFLIVDEPTTGLDPEEPDSLPQDSRALEPRPHHSDLDPHRRRYLEHLRGDRSSRSGSAVV